MSDTVPSIYSSQAKCIFYSAPVRETRQLWSKMLQTKLVNLFAASSPDLLKTEMIGNGTAYQVRQYEHLFFRATG